MKSPNLKPLSLAPALDPNQTILHERLALQRIKELAWAERLAPDKASRWAVQSAEITAALWRALFRPAILLKQIEPGKPPVEVNDLERIKASRAMHLL